MTVWQSLTAIPLEAHAHPLVPPQDKARRTSKEMLDIELFRSNPDLIRESQRRRYKDIGLVDKVIEFDNEWRKSACSLIPRARWHSA